MNLNIIVKVRVGANVDGLMDRLTEKPINGWKTRSLHRTMLKVSVTKTKIKFKILECHLLQILL